MVRAYLRSWQYAGPDELTANWIHGAGRQRGDGANEAGSEIAGSQPNPQLVSESTAKSTKRRDSQPN